MVVNAEKRHENTRFFKVFFFDSLESHFKNYAAKMTLMEREVGKMPYEETKCVGKRKK